MKQNIFMMLCVVFFGVVLFENKVYAKELHVDDNSILLYSEDYNEALELRNVIECEVIDFVDGGLEGSASDAVWIDYENSIKVYVDIDCFKNQYIGKSILSLVENANYAWEVPVTYKGENYRITLSKGLPLSEKAMKYLSEEEQSEIKESEGKLKVVSIGTVNETDYIYKYITEIGFMLPEDGVVVVLGSQPGFGLPVAVVEVGGIPTSVFSLGYLYDLYIDEKNIETDFLYDYETVVEAVCNMEFPAENDIGGYAQNLGESSKNEIKEFKTNYIILSIVGLLVLCSIIVGIYLKDVNKHK